MTARMARRRATSRRDQTRRRIVRAAAAAFRVGGIEAVGLRDVMKRAGMTQGGFYFHFKDKDDLFAEAARSVVEDLETRLFEPMANAPPGKGLEAFIEAYLSPDHRDRPESGCMMAALGTDAGRGNSKHRQALGEVAKIMLDRITPYVPGENVQARRKRAGLLLSSMAGVLMVSRVIDTESSDGLLAAARRFYLAAFAA